MNLGRQLAPIVLYANELMNPVTQIYFDNQISAPIVESSLAFLPLTTEMQHARLTFNVHK